MWQEYLGLTKQSHWLYSTGLRCFCSKSTSYATLLWRWSATAGIRIPHARTLAHANILVIQSSFVHGINLQYCGAGDLWAPECSTWFDEKTCMVCTT